MSRPRLQGRQLWKGDILGCVVHGRLRAVSFVVASDDLTEARVLVHCRRTRATENADPWADVAIVPIAHLMELPHGNPKRREAFEDKDRRPLWAIAAFVKNYPWEDHGHRSESPRQQPA